MNNPNGLPISRLNDLPDVATNTPSDGWALTWEASTSRWTPKVLPAAPVASVFGRTGAVVAASGDYTVGQVTGAAPLASPPLTGTPTAPTATVGTNTAQLATCAFVAAVDATLVHKTGTETIAGAKTFTDTLKATSLDANTVGGSAVPVHIGTTGVAGQEIYPGIWFTRDAATLANFAFLSDVGQGTILNAPLGKYVAIRIGNAPYLHIEDAIGVQVRQAKAINFAADSSTTANQIIAALTPSWIVSTHASRRGRVICSVQDAAGAREAWRAESDGTQALMRFLGGGTAVGRQTVTGSRSSGAAWESFLAAMVAFGFVTDSTTP